MFLPHLAPGRLTAVAAPAGTLRSLHHTLLHEALLADPAPVYYLDGASTLSCVGFAEHLLRNGHGIELANDRVHTHRALTPFNWIDMLTDTLEAGLQADHPSLVVAGWWNAQFEKEEDLPDWEQERWVAETLDLMRGIAHRHKARLVLTLDLARWTRTHPMLAQLLRRGVDSLLHATLDPRGWSLHASNGQVLLEPPPTRQTLDAWLEEALPLARIPTRKSTRIARHSPRRAIQT